MSRFARHRYLVYLPFALFFIATVLGGWINTVELRGRVVDDLTSDGIKAATLTHGQRTVTTDETGAFDFANLPKSSRLSVTPPYLSSFDDPGEILLARPPSGHREEAGARRQAHRQAMCVRATSARRSR